jgi:DNA-directed RNA polymerase specialized sigma24 family protein
MKHDFDHKRFHAALDRLPPVPRAVYLLSATDGLSYGDIAFRLGLSVGEVQMYLAQALSSLTGLMEDP